MKKLIIYIILIISSLIVGKAQTAQPSSGTPEEGHYHVYFGLLHCHSAISDGKGSPDEAYRFARDSSKLDFFSLSDHDSYPDRTTMEEYQLIKTVADKYNQDGVFTTFRSFEWTSKKYGHITITNSADICYQNDSLTNTIPRLFNWLNNRECVAFLNHPGIKNGVENEFGHFNDSSCDRIVGIELFNDVEDFRQYYYNDGFYADDGNKSYYDEALSRGWKLGAAGSDDNHWASWGKKTGFRLAVLATENAREAIYDALKKRRFYSTLDMNLKIDFTLAGKPMGSTIEPGNAPLLISASDDDGEVFNRIELVRNGTIIQTWFPNSAKPEISFNLKTKKGDYFYVITKQEDQDAAISSPIWIKD